MSDKPTYMDCWHFVAPLIPVDTDYTIDIYIMVFGALKEAEKKRIAEKKKGGKATQVLEDRPCVVCGAVFMPKVVQQITCSPECSRARRHEMAKDLRQRARERQKCAKTKEDA